MTSYQFLGGELATSPSDVRPSFSSTESITVGNTTSEQTIVAPGLGALIIPANARQVGGRISLIMQGIISSSGNPTLCLRLKLGDTVVADTGAQTIGNNTDAHFTVSATSLTNIIGSSGELAIGGSFITEDDIFGFANVGTVPIDTTMADAVNVTATWGTASAGNSITVQLTSFINYSPPS